MRFKSPLLSDLYLAAKQNEEQDAPRAVHKHHSPQFRMHDSIPGHCSRQRIRDFNPVLISDSDSIVLN